MTMQGNAAAEASEHADAASPKQPSEAAERSEAPNSAEQVLIPLISSLATP